MPFTTQDLTRIGERLRGLRQDRGMSYRRLARKAGVSLSTIQAVEAGRRPQVGVATLTTLAEALGSDLAHVLG